MKQLVTLVFALLFANCKAQTINLENKGAYRHYPDGAYFKDVNNLLNTFEGTWLYTNGTTSLKIVMIKKTQQYNGRYYEDLIIGEYEYKVNGVVVISTLNELNNNYSNQRSHSIDSNTLMTNNNNNNRPICTDCTTNERRLGAGFEDPVQDSYGTMIVKKTTVGSQEAIKIKTRRTGMGYVWIEGTPPPPADFTVPAGEYTLIKQLIQKKSL